MSAKRVWWLLNVGAALAAFAVAALTGELLLGLIVGWLIHKSPLAFTRLMLELVTTRKLREVHPGCLKCQRLPVAPTRAVELAQFVGTRMSYRYRTNCFHCPDCGAEEYWADVLRRHRVPVPQRCSSLADFITENGLTA